MTNIKRSLYALILLLLMTQSGFSGDPFRAIETDNPDQIIVGFFDLRERETFIQVTNVDTDTAGNNVHIQIFDVSNNCNENDFFDLYTPNDTHVYDLRNLTTNDGNDSGVVLPDGAYGVFVAFGQSMNFENPQELIGNLRIMDITGYEYRTNLNGLRDTRDGGDLEEFSIFNFSLSNGQSLSDIIAIPTLQDFSTQEIRMADVLDSWISANVDIYNLDEVPFSCRNVIFACVTEDHPLYEELLANIGDASVASFEWGINDVIPNSKGAELLCPGNNIPDGFVRFESLSDGPDAFNDMVMFVGLNNGNGRGTIDTFINSNDIRP